MPNAIRFQYTREDGLKYIAHLDMMRLFERTLKRSGLPVAHTQGFSPRMKLVFGLPMALGLTSEGDYADIEFDREILPDEFEKAMNDSLPPGVRVTAAAPLGKSDNIMNLISGAQYEITFIPGCPVDRQGMYDHVQEVLAKEQLLVMKKGKKGMKEVNIRPLIYSLSAARDGGESWILEAFLNAGAEDNLRPELVMDAWTQVTGMPVKVIHLHRKALFASVGNEWLDPMDPEFL